MYMCGAWRVGSIWCCQFSTVKIQVIHLFFVLGKGWIHNGVPQIPALLTCYPGRNGHQISGSYRSASGEEGKVQELILIDTWAILLFILKRLHCVCMYILGCSYGRHWRFIAGFCETPWTYIEVLSPANPERIHEEAVVLLKWSLHFIFLNAIWLLTGVDLHGWNILVCHRNDLYAEDCFTPSCGCMKSFYIIAIVHQGINNNNTCVARLWWVFNSKAKVPRSSSHVLTKSRPPNHQWMCEFDSKTVMS